MTSNSITSTSGELVPGAFSGQAARQPKPKRVRNANGKLIQPGPYSIAASCELSEDYFLTDEVPIGDGDKVMPFLNPQNNMVEAVVLTRDPNGQSSLAHLHRDPAATSGWTYTVIDTPFGGFTDATVAASAARGVMVMALGQPDPGPTLVHACMVTLNPGGSGHDWSLTSNAAIPALAGPLGGGSTGAGDLYWYGWTQQANSKTHNWDYTFWRWDGTGDRAGVGGGIVVMVLSFALSSETSPVRAQLMLDATIGGSTASCAVVMLNDINSPTDGGYFINAYRLTDGNPTPTETVMESGGAASLLWSYVSAANTSGVPAQLWQGTNGTISFIDETGAQTSIYDGGSVGEGEVAVWQLDDLYTFTILDRQSQVASVVTQIGNPVTGFTLPIPLAGGIDRIYSLPTDPSQGTLFAVDTLGTLNVLTKDPTLGWTQTQVHQDGVKNQPVTSWRAQISILDANGIGVGNGQIQLSADRPVGLWQVSGSTILIPGTPVTVTTAGSGKTTVSIPAEELDTARVVAQALDSTGKPSGAPLTVTPDIDVHNFLAGQCSLTGAGTLDKDGAALINAQIPVDPTNPGGPQTKLFPSLTSANQASAGAVAQAINHVATLGLQPDVAGAVQSAVFDLNGSTATFSTSPSPGGFNSLRGELGDSSWWDSAKNDAESAFHGLRHGVITFKHMLSSWDQVMKQWSVDLTVDIGNGIDNLMTFVITDIKTAIHAISSFFQALGADIKSAWEWLKHNVLELIKNADTNAGVIQGWLDQAHDQFKAIINRVEITSDTFFEDQENDVTTKIGDLSDYVEDKLFGTSEPMPAPPTDSSGNDADLLFKVAGDIGKVWNHTPCGWLYDKIESYLPKDAAGPDFVAADFTQVINDVIKDVSGAVETIVALGNTFYDAIKLAGASKDSFSAMSVADFFGSLNTSVVDALKLLDQLVDSALDALKAALDAFETLLTYPFPGVQAIEDLLELAGIKSPTITIEYVISMIVAYPATLVTKLITKNWTLFPFTDSQANAAAKATIAGKTPDWAGFGLNIAAAFTQLLWAAEDLVLDYYSFPVPPDTPNPSTVFDQAMDIVCPAILSILQWPGPIFQTTGGQTEPPFKYNDFTNPQDFGEHGNFLIGTVVTSAVPWLASLLAMIVKGIGLDPMGWVSSHGVAAYQTGSGAVNTILGCWYTKANASSTAVGIGEVILGVMSNLSYEDTVLGIKEITGSTEETSLFVKMVIDTVGNFGTAIGYAGNALACIA